VSAVHVAVGVIVDAEDRVLISRRPKDVHQGGLWEFPGGKVEKGETVEVALTRELDEELGIQVLKAEPLLEIEHDYSDKKVRLDVYLVSCFSGIAEGREGQKFSWVKKIELSNYHFPEANTSILNAIQADGFTRCPDRR